MGSVSVSKGLILILPISNMSSSGSIFAQSKELNSTLEMLCFLLFFCYSVQNTSFQPSGSARKFFHQSRNKAKAKPLHCLQRNPYTAKNVGKTIHCKTENDIGKYHHWYSQKNQVKENESRQYWLSSSSSHSKKILSTTNKFPNSTTKNPRDMGFLRAGRLYVNNNVFSCAIVLLTIFLSKIRINFIYVNITHVFLTDFTLAKGT